MGTGLPFRPATFDACISISALQWLCYSNSAQQNPKKRLTRFFSSLYTVLKRGGRAVLQFYPETAEQAVLISETATACGFSGGVVVDYPNSAKAKKHYLVLSFDRSAAQKKGAIEAGQQQRQKQNQVQVGSNSGTNGRDQGKSKVVVRKKKGTKTKEWILHKKETERNRGKTVRPDTKYTARKRPTKF
jgi:18S rRNA (guanine1575-N7)-methyltransferase